MKNFKDTASFSLVIIIALLLMKVIVQGLSALEGSQCSHSSIMLFSHAGICHLTPAWFVLEKGEWLSGYVCITCGRPVIFIQV